jgi:hypothetical protein
MQLPAPSLAHASGYSAAAAARLTLPWRFVILNISDHGWIANPPLRPPTPAATVGIVAAATY